MILTNQQIEITKERVPHQFVYISLILILIIIVYTFIIYTFQNKHTYIHFIRIFIIPPARKYAQALV